MKMNPFVALWKCFPYIIGGGLLGLVVYNPTGYSLYDLIYSVVVNGLGYVNGVDWYFQPAPLAMVLVVLFLGTALYFNWEIARNEKVYLAVYIFAVLVVNMILLGLGQWLGHQWLGLMWIKWQVVPVLFSGVVYAATLPRVRRAYSTAVTAGGGSLDEVHDYGHEHEQEM